MYHYAVSSINLNMVPFILSFNTSNKEEYVQLHYPTSSKQLTHSPFTTFTFFLHIQYHLSYPSLVML
jgi:hypothetical protein